MNASKEDMDKVLGNFPGLSYRESVDGKVFEGSLEFSASYDKVGGNYTIDPSPGSHPLIIRDAYLVKVIIPWTGQPPSIYETGGRIPKDLDRHKSTQSDLVCAWGPLDNGHVGSMVLTGFFDGIVVPFFFDQTYFCKHGVWPRGEYSHGSLGALQNYYALLQQGEDLASDCIALIKKDVPAWPTYRNLISSARRSKGHDLCLCGSGLRFRNCQRHPEVLRALWSLQDYISVHPDLIN